MKATITYLGKEETIEASEVVLNHLACAFYDAAELAESRCLHLTAQGTKAEATQIFMQLMESGYYKEVKNH